MGPLPGRLAPLAARPRSSALFLDFDGTLAPIVPDPAAAAPLEGVVPVLGALARRLALVAVVSGRPVTYLATVLGPPAGVRLIGLYGMEELGPDGTVRTAADLERWRDPVGSVTAAALAEAPPGVGVEPKGLTVTLHWRGSPDGEAWARPFAERAMREVGLVAQEGRQAMELRPPVEADKGTVVRRLGEGHDAMACFGDDLGDLAAFAALDRFAALGVDVTKVAVVDAESPPQVAAAADLVVEGPAGALTVLGQLSGA